MSPAGAVQTLMSVDADRVVNLCVSLHELWSLPAQTAIALYLLYTQVSRGTALSHAVHSDRSLCGHYWTQRSGFVLQVTAAVV